MSLGNDLITLRAHKMDSGSVSALEPMVVGNNDASILKASAFGGHPKQGLYLVYQSETFLTVCCAIVCYMN